MKFGFKGHGLIGPWTTIGVIVNHCNNLCDMVDDRPETSLLSSQTHLTDVIRLGACRYI